VAAPAIVGIIAAAAEAFAEQLGQTVGEGLVETLFNQQAINRNLEDIKKKLDELIDYLRNEMPSLVERKVELVLARDIGYKIIEKADTIAGSIATLKKSRQLKEAPGVVQNHLAALVSHAEQIAEMGGTLITYGQPFYTSVGVAFAAMLKAYEATIAESPSTAASLRTRLTSWQPRLAPWIDHTRPSSLAAAYDWVENRQKIGLKVLPTFWTWDTHVERRVALSWNQFGESVMVFGAWYGFYKDDAGRTYMNGNLLGQMLPPDLSVDSARAQGVLQFTIPESEWWEVKHNTPASRADYDEAAARLSSLQQDFERYPKLMPAVKGAMDLVVEMERQIVQILDHTKDLEEQLPFLDGPQLHALMLQQVAQAVDKPESRRWLTLPVGDTRETRV